MTNDGGNDENDNANTKPSVSNVRHSTSTSSVTQRQQTNGSIGNGGGGGGGGSGLNDGNISCAEADGSASDDCGDKLATESDPLQPKMVKSRSAHKVREIKEVRIAVN